MAMVKPGTILGHEGVGIVGEFGPDVRNFSIGDRVVIASTIACGYCSYCRVGYFAQCDQANPKGPHAGTAFFGGPEMTGPFHRLQAEMARIPFANIGMVKLPDEVDDDEAVPLSDIFPTGYFIAESIPPRSPTGYGGRLWLRPRRPIHHPQPQAARGWPYPGRRQHPLTA
jgi:threonine dehydrogenase-like Zn-dependent dehydrogenase